MSRYDVESILNSDLPIGAGAAARASKFQPDVLSLPAPNVASPDMLPPAEKDYWSLLAMHYQQQQQHHLQQQQFPASAFETYGSGVNVDFTMGMSGTNNPSGGGATVWGATGATGHGGDGSRQSNSYASNIPYTSMLSGSAASAGGGYEGSTGNNGTWVTTSNPAAGTTAPQYYNYLFGME